MSKSIFLICTIMIIGISTNYAYSQEIGLSTFQESAQVLIDDKISQETIVSITLLSSNIQEIQISTQLEQKIRDNERIQAIVVTNENNCVLGVTDQSCIIINIERDPDDKGINAIQDSTKIIAESLIGEINQVLDTNAGFFQVYIHTAGESNEVLETSGVISGKGTISAVYTMSMEDTYSMYEKLSSILLSKQIRESGGFYNTARNLSTEENAKMSFSIIPTETKTLLQLKVSKNNQISSPIQIPGTSTEINPLEFFKIKELTRSDYFSTGNYPLNSIFQIIILSDEEMKVSDVRGNIIASQNIDGIEIPIEIMKKGWIFDPQEGQQIQGKYIFGESISVNENEFRFSLGGASLQFEETESNESIITIIIITTVSIGVAIFYLKGYKK